MKVLEDSKGLRNALSAVLAMLRERGGAEHVLLIVPEKDVVDWKSAAMKAQDEVNVTCFVKAAGATKNCLANLAKCRKPGIVIAAKEYLHKKTRDPSKAPYKKLCEALHTGGASRWEVVLFQCSDADLSSTCAALTLLEQQRLDTLVLFAEESSSKLTTPKVLQTLSDRFPTVERNDVELTLPDMGDQSPPRVRTVKPAAPNEHGRRDSGRIVLQPLQGNFAVAPRVKKAPRRSLSETPTRRRRSSSHSVFDDESTSDSGRRRSQGRLSSSPRREVKRGVSRRGRISRDHVQTSLRESLENMSSPYRPSFYSPLVVMKRKNRRSRTPDYETLSSSLVSEDEKPEKTQGRKGSVSIDSICDDLAKKRSKKEHPEIIVIDSDFDADCFVVSETKASPCPPPRKLSSAKKQSLLKPKIGQGRSSISPKKRRSPLKTRSATLKKVIAASEASGSVSGKSPARRGSVLTDHSANDVTHTPTKSHAKSPFAKALEDAVERKHAAAIAHSLRKKAVKRTTPLPKFDEGGPTYAPSGHRRSSSVKEPTYEKPQLRKSSSAKKERTPTVKYAARGLIPPEKRKRYNAALRKAKAADKSGDEEEALKWYEYCNEISDHDQTLMARILCFGGFALMEFDKEKEKRRLSFKSISPKRSGRSGSPIQDSASIVRSRSRQKEGAKTGVPSCEVIVIDD